MTYQYIIVGAGSAGCVLAERLSADPKNRVLLLEAGNWDRKPLIHIPAALPAVAPNLKLNWGYYTEPEPHLHNRSLFWPRGKTIGGSSSINGMVYTRGNAGDYDRWANLGAEGWSHREVLPYFKRVEANERGAGQHHGADGLLRVTRARRTSALCDMFVDAGKQAGYKLSDDFNGEDQEGFGDFDATVYRGRRWSTATAFLRRARARRNLTVITGALASRVLWKGSRAVGVEYRRRNKIEQAHCEGEVILSGGTINSPQLLQLSGVGPADHLRKLGIPVVADRAQVGENLQDHLCVCLMSRITKPISHYRWLHPVRGTAVALQYAATRTGLAAQAPLSTGAFLKSSPELQYPDLQLHLTPALVTSHDSSWPNEHGLTIYINHGYPASRGSVRAASSDAGMHPRIFANYLSAPGDLPMLRQGVKMTMDVLAQNAFDGVRGTALTLRHGPVSDAEIDEFIRAQAETVYHPVGTCRMGKDDDAVVDPQLKVNGVEGLRVADASVMPALINGNTNAPTIMIADRASDIILGIGEYSR
ncbi:GMC family oxidoreductase [Hyphomicrobium sp. 99]|uniref:GMC family oxidoreductase n=1 Tax=Hyphomicrobium sp. 99 TaxID=1163419 RepID=UPI0005F7B767|nr:choline dehydrogenase [Hyphomicrobium sp. 99]